MRPPGTNKGTWEIGMPDEPDCFLLEFDIDFGEPQTRHNPGAPIEVEITNADEFAKFIAKNLIRWEHAEKVDVWFEPWEKIERLKPITTVVNLSCKDVVEMTGDEDPGRKYDEAELAVTLHRERGAV